jgi:2-polyprenyl-3-methyl-5-hydroxy-6-metoxy-1,4-benzoquinol methylase
MTHDPVRHWQTVYETKASDEVSWFQREPRLSHALIARVAPSLDAAIVDVGGGASTLVDALLADGYTNVTVLDLAEAALRQARARLGPDASRVTWSVADILDATLPPASIDVWHDRAVFHFLTRAEDRARYIAQVQRAVRPGGYVLVATFAEDGPTRCSGLEVARYSATQLHGVFGAGFVLESSLRESHMTPSGGQQAFTYCLCRWDPDGSVRSAA